MQRYVTIAAILFLLILGGVLLFRLITDWEMVLNRHHYYGTVMGGSELEAQVGEYHCYQKRSILFITTDWQCFDTPEEVDEALFGR